MYTCEWNNANWNLYKEEAKKRVNEVNGKITEIVQKMSEIMLDAAKISFPEKKGNKRNKPYCDEELTEL